MYFKKLMYYNLLKNKFNGECFKNEDKTVLSFLNKLEKNKIYKYLEVGSGAGRFPFLIKNLFRNLSIECLEINPDLAKLTADNGLPTVVESVLHMKFEKDSFDLVHCSHVIEHFKYPEITSVLDEMLRVTKFGGYIIIRSPLMHPGFYIDIDHIRPYPPETILNYFNNKQQQKVGQYNVKEIGRWYRRENLKIEKGGGKLVYFINLFLIFLWVCFKFPFSKRNGYILILQKI